jgi:hypothetical protein
LKWSFLFQAIDLIVAMDGIGIPFHNTNLANDLMPKLLADMEDIEPAKVVNM